MREDRLKTLRAALGVLMLAVGCDAPTQPTPQAPAPPPISESTLAALTGDYTLTVNLSNQCSALPDTLRRRTYQATIEATPFRYLVIRIAGGGFSEPIVPGELWPSAAGRVEIEWNNFDIGGCDGYPEPLPDGISLMICGVGTGTVDGPTISLTLNGEVFIEEAGRRRHVCQAEHQFTFTRLPE